MFKNQADNSNLISLEVMGPCRQLRKAGICEGNLFICRHRNSKIKSRHPELVNTLFFWGFITWVDGEWMDG